MASKIAEEATEDIGTHESDYRMLLERSADAIVVVDHDRTIRFINPAASVILSGKVEELLGIPLPITFPYEPNIKKELAITNSDGEVTELEMHTMETNWQGEKAYFISLRDITERNRAERAFRDTAGRYQALTDHLNVGVYRNTPGPKGRFIEVNPANFKMFGYESKEELLSMDVVDLYQNPADREKLSEKLSRLGSAKEEIRLKKKDGTPFIGLVSAVAVKDEDGKVIYFDGIIEDITERRNTERLIRIQRDLSLALSNANSLDETMKLSVEAAIDISGMDCGGIYLVDGESGELDLVFHKGLSPEVVENISHYDPDSMNARLVMEGKPIYARYEEMGVPVEEAGIRIVAAIPVRHEGQVISCLNVASHTLEDITRATRNAIEAIASQIGSSIARVQAEESLRESEERYRLLVENANEIILVAQDGEIKFVNSKITEMTGYTEEEAMARPFIDFIYPDDRDLISERYEGRLKGEDVPRIYPFRTIDKKGNVKWVQVNSELITWEGRPATLNLLTDITERRRADEALRESEKKYRLLIESSNASVSVMREDGVFLLLNKVAAASVGGQPDELIGESLYDIISKEEAAKVMKLVHETINSGKGQTNEGLLKLPVGDRWISANIQPIIEPDGSISSVQVISQDITRYKRQEEALRRSLERESQAFAQGRIEIVDTILHNIGNAINSVTIGTGTVQILVKKLTEFLSSLASAIEEHQEDFSDYVKNDPQGQKVAPFIIALADEFGGSNGKLMEAVERVSERAERVADITRIVKEVSGGPYLKDIDLKKTMENAINVLKDSIEKRPIKISYSCERAPEEISTNESQFHQMLVNLIKNSIEAIDDLRELKDTDDTHFIKIECYSEGESLILKVTDDGIGIEKEMQEVVFRPAYTTKKSGTGLGLHSIANFVKGYDGQIQALSNGHGKGTTMRIVLPLNRK